MNLAILGHKPVGSRSAGMKYDKKVCEKTLVNVDYLHNFDGGGQDRVRPRPLGGNQSRRDEK